MEIVQFGESSLPFEQFASRIHIFHIDVLQKGEPDEVTEQELETLKGYIDRS